MIPGVKWWHGAGFGRGKPRTPNRIGSIIARRCDGNPLVDFAASPALGDNINGPSVIRVPPWVKNPHGNYYLYLAHHRGTQIRLAFADDLRGPWRIHPSGVLSLEQAKIFHGHIASPDVHVDERDQQIRMYFHGLGRGGGQQTALATSKTGLTFAPSGIVLDAPYLRMFRWKKACYGVAMRGKSGWGTLCRSPDGIAPFECRGNFIRRARHTAVLVRGDELLVFHSRVHDAPERIVVVTVTLGDDWNRWEPSEPVEVIRPEEDYDGVGFPNRRSRYGPATGVRQLRDPCIFQEDGRTYLFYSIAGEMGIAMAELTITMKPDQRQSPL